VPGSDDIVSANFALNFDSSMTETDFIAVQSDTDCTEVASDNELSTCYIVSET
jgi:hypothetical protein